MKDITSNTYRNLFNWFLFIFLSVSFIRRFWENDSTSVIFTILYVTTSVGGLLAFAATLIKGWFETRSIKQVYEDNKLWLIGSGACLILLLIVGLVRAI